MHDVTTLDCSRIAQDLQIRKVQVENVVRLLDEGNTIPFITRYRKEMTGNLNEEVIRQIQLRVQHQRQLSERKQTILRSIETQGKLTEELHAAILAADTTKRLEDLYLPYKPRKRTLATMAREKGLEPLALAIWYRDPAVSNLPEVLPSLVNPEKELNAPEDVQTGVGHILAEMISEIADVRAVTRQVLWGTGALVATRSEKATEEQAGEYKDYFKFTETVRQIPPHRILALNRGEKENALAVKMEWAQDEVRQRALHALAEYCQKHVSTPPVTPPAASVAGTAVPAAEGTTSTEVSPPPEEMRTPSEGTPAPTLPAAFTPANEGEPLAPGAEFRSPHTALLRTVLDDALNRLVLPSLEREIRKELTEEAQHHAVAVFARNLRSLLLQRPLRGKRVLAIDPGFRTGCKLAALDEYGNMLEQAVIYPHGGGPKKERGERERGKKNEHEHRPAAATEAAPAPAAATPPTPVGDSAPTAVAAGDGSVAVTPEVSGTPASSGEVPAPVPLLTESVALAATGEGVPAEVAAHPEAVVPQTESTTAAPEPVKPTRRGESLNKLEQMVREYRLEVVAIGNGTACRETEEVVAELIAERVPELAYVIVNEAGASVYSASPQGREEFPNLDATVRSSISIGRRLQDPLAELVKVEPQNIGVGLYQHDVNTKELKESLDTVVESCVNQVGVDLNTASVPLLRHVSGLNQLAARELVDYRQKNGAFRNRSQIQEVPNIGPARWTQAAGFLKVHAGDDPLDATWIHPESYDRARRLLGELGYGTDVILDGGRRGEFQEKLRALQPDEVAGRLETDRYTARDIIDALLRPDRDPREDLPPPIFKKGILKIEDLQPGMELKGTVLNVVDFGAFVDIGLKDSGLVHISQMANRYIKNPYEVVAVGDVVNVWVLNVDQARHRVSLTMIKPGTEKKPPERRPERGGEHGERREQSAERGPRPAGDRPPPRREGAPAGARPGGPPRGPRPGGPPRGPRPGGPGRGPRPHPAHAEAGGPPAAKPAPPPPPPPRKPRRDVPRPKLSKAALEGKEALRTFGELSAFFAARKHEDTPPPKPAVAEQPAAPAPEAPAADTPPAEPPSVEQATPAPQTSVEKPEEAVSGSTPQ